MTTNHQHSSFTLVLNSGKKVEGSFSVINNQASIVIVETRISKETCLPPIFVKSVNNTPINNVAKWIAFQYIWNNGGHKDSKKFKEFSIKVKTKNSLINSYPSTLKKFLVDSVIVNEGFNVKAGSVKVGDDEGLLEKNKGPNLIEYVEVDNGFYPLSEIKLTTPGGVLKGEKISFLKNKSDLYPVDKQYCNNDEINELLWNARIPYKVSKKFMKALSCAVSKKTKSVIDKEKALGASSVCLYLYENGVCKVLKGNSFEEAGKNYKESSLILSIKVDI